MIWLFFSRDNSVFIVSLVFVCLDGEFDNNFTWVKKKIAEFLFL